MNDFSYSWQDEQHTTVKLEVDNQPPVFIPAVPNNRDYIEYLAWCSESNQTAKEYVAPPPLPEPTPEEKLAAADLTVDELKDLLGI